MVDRWKGVGRVRRLAGVVELQFTGGWYVFSYRANRVMPGELSAAELRAGMDARYPR